MSIKTAVKGMASSFAPQCSELKTKYDDCFNDWYANDFLKGHGQATNPCDQLFAEYRACIQGTLKSSGLEGMLEEARKEHPFTKDAAR